MNMFMEKSSNWLEPPDSLSLQAGQVHVWQICLEQDGELLDRFRRTLTPEELDRAGRFRFERLQRHFIVSRGFLRHVLARYLDSKPFGATVLLQRLRKALVGWRAEFSVQHVAFA